MLMPNVFHNFHQLNLMQNTGLTQLKMQLLMHREIQFHSFVLTQPLQLMQGRVLWIL